MCPAVPEGVRALETKRETNSRNLKTVFMYRCINIIYYILISTKDVRRSFGPVGSPAGLMSSSFSLLPRPIGSTSKLLAVFSPLEGL